MHLSAFRIGVLGFLDTWYVEVCGLQRCAIGYWVSGGARIVLVCSHVLRYIKIYCVLMIPDV